jgi:hypothetical protein
MRSGQKRSSSPTCRSNCTTFRSRNTRSDARLLSITVSRGAPHCSFAFQCVRVLQGCLFVGGQAAFDFLHIFGGGQAFGANAPAEEGLAHGGVVGDVFARNLRFGAHLVGACVVDSDLGGEVLGFENDRWRKVRERTAVWDLPVSFHGLGALAEECLVALAANEGEVLIAPGLLKDELGQFLFGGGELLAGGDALGFKEALLDQLRAAGLDGEVSLGKGDLLLPGIAIPGDEVAGVAGEHDVINLTPGARADFDHFVDVNKMVCGAVAGDLAGGFGLGNSGLAEVAPLGVTEGLLAIVGQPVFAAALGPLSVTFKGVGELMNEVGFHQSRLVGAES